MMKMERQTKVPQGFKMSTYLQQEPSCPKLILLSFVKLYHLQKVSRGLAEHKTHSLLKLQKYHLHWVQTTVKPREPKDVLHHIPFGDLFHHYHVPGSVIDWLTAELAVHWAPPRWGEALGQSQALEFPSVLILEQQLAQAPWRAASLPAQAARVMCSVLRNRQGSFLVRRVYKGKSKIKTSILMAWGKKEKLYTLIALNIISGVKHHQTWGILSDLFFFFWLDFKSLLQYMSSSSAFCFLY